MIIGKSEHRPTQHRPQILDPLGQTLWFSFPVPVPAPAQLGDDCRGFGLRGDDDRG